VDVRHEAALSQQAPEPGSDQTSHPDDVAKLTAWDQQLSVIAEEAIDLQQELSRLREESAAVVHLLEQRERELEEKTASLVQVTDERDRTDKSMTAANASLSEAQARLKQDRERMASLERLLEQRERELEEKTALLVQVTDERDRTDKSMTAANASLSEAQARLKQDRERMASLEQLLELRQVEPEHATALEEELNSLRAHVVELEELETRRAAMPPQPRSHLRLIALSTGYALSESAELPPPVGALIGIDGRQYAVASSGRSPLPGDERPCVLLLVEPSRTEQSRSPDASEPAVGSLAEL
jgi:chromosome segregation ATPase